MLSVNSVNFYALGECVQILCTLEDLFSAHVYGMARIPSMYNLSFLT